MTTVAQKVKALLENETIGKELADDNMRLIVNVWKQEFNYHRMTGEQVLRFLCCPDKFARPSSPESITRVSRKLQEENPSLRGPGYKERKQKEKDFDTSKILDGIEHQPSLFES